MSEQLPLFKPPFLTEEVPVLLISLSDQQERRETMLSRGVPREWIISTFPAVDKRGAEVEELRQATLAPEFSVRYCRPPVAGEIGCAMSHRQAALWLAASEYDLALVLEDDVVPRGSGWETQCIEIARALLPYARRNAAFVCLLGARPDQTNAALHRPVLWNGQGPDSPQLFEHVDPDRTLWRTHAYLISRGAAERSRAHEVRLLTLADDWGARLRLGMIDELFYTRPTLFTQDEKTTSNIAPRQDRLHQERSLSHAPNIAQRIVKSLAFRAMMARARWRADRSRRLPTAKGS